MCYEYKWSQEICFIEYTTILKSSNVLPGRMIKGMFHAYEKILVK